MKKIIGLFLSVFFAASAFALSLDQAKSQGILGETSSGYLAQVSGADLESAALMNEINRKRKVEYQKIAARNGTALNLVETLAGKQAIEKTPAGQYVQNSAGKWSKK